MLSALAKKMGYETRRVARDPAVPLTNPHASRLLADHPTADDRAFAVDVRNRREFLEHVSFGAIFARGLHVLLHRVHGDVRALAREQRLSGVLEHAMRLVEACGQQIAVAGKQLPENRKYPLVREDHLPRRL